LLFYQKKGDKMKHIKFLFEKEEKNKKNVRVPPIKMQNKLNNNKIKTKKEAGISLIFAIKNKNRIKT
jgi:hypothetical protein